MHTNVTSTKSLKRLQTKVNLKYGWMKKTPQVIFNPERHPNFRYSLQTTDKLIPLGEKAEVARRKIETLALSEEV